MVRSFSSKLEVAIIREDFRSESHQITVTLRSLNFWFQHRKIQVVRMVLQRG